MTSEQETSRLFRLLSQDLAALGTGIDFEIPSTLTTKHMPGYASVGIIKDPKAQFGHSRFLWESRVACKPVFEALYNTDDFITSFDSAGVFPNWGHPDIGRKSRTKDIWLHVDQGHASLGDGRRCVQGVLNLLDSNTRTGGFVACPGSHLDFPTFMANRPRNKNFVTLDQNAEDIKALIQKKPPVFVEAPAGSMILWDSRTIHSNSPAVGSAPPIPPLQALPSVLRAVAYVCLLPRSCDTPESAAARIEFVKQGTTTSHCPILPHMKVERLLYPRHKSLHPITGSAGLSPVDVLRTVEYLDLL